MKIIPGNIWIQDGHALKLQFVPKTQAPPEELFCYKAVISSGFLGECYCALTVMNCLDWCNTRCCFKSLLRLPSPH